MNSRPVAVCLILAWLPGAVMAAPRVVTDLPAIHSLVSQVMAEIGQPKLLMRDGSSPHDYSLRPSEAGMLQSAEIVFWIGPELTPWLEHTLKAIAANARSIDLLDHATVRLAYRSQLLFQVNAHTIEPIERQRAGTNGTSFESKQARVDAEDQHETRHSRQHRGDTDPHAWLDPLNAMAWLSLIADELATLDPHNADHYQTNAESARTALSTLINHIETTLGERPPLGFVVFHDSYQYFEQRFEVPAVAAIALGDSSRPSPARFLALRQAITAAGVHCVFSEPQFDPSLLQAITDGTAVKRGALDPVGFNLVPGPELYWQLLSNLAEQLSSCR